MRCKNINTLYPADLSDKKFIETLKSYNADLYIVYAYGKILPPELISLPKYGVINIHCSLLPKWRGAAPIQRALEKGDLKTGVTFFKIDESLDTGAIIASYEYNIEEKFWIYGNNPKSERSTIKDVINILNA